MWTLKHVNIELEFELLFLKTQSILLRLGRFINYLPYKSDEMSYVAFPDERYENTNSQQHAEMKFEKLQSTHVNDKFLWECCEQSRCVTHKHNLHACK